MKRLLYLCGFILFLYACKKDQQFCTTEESVCVDATVKWMGEPAADGLGWTLLKDSTLNTYYIPINLPDNMKTDGLKVNACIIRTDQKFICGMCVSFPDMYHILSIRQR